MYYGIYFGELKSVGILYQHANGFSAWFWVSTSGFQSVGKRWEKALPM
jgi:hypothetical protein